MFEFRGDSMERLAGLFYKPVNQQVERIGGVLREDEMLGRPVMEKSCKGFSGGRRIVHGTIPRRPPGFVHRLAEACSNFLHYF